MEIYERINELLIIKKMTKREFARKLINLQPISNRTGEVISESIIYSYLSLLDSLYFRCIKCFN